MLQPRADESFIVNTEFMRIKGQIEIVNFYEQVARYPLQDLVCRKYVPLIWAIPPSRADGPSLGRGQGLGRVRLRKLREHPGR